MSQYNNNFAYLSNAKEYLSNDISLAITNIENILKHQPETYGEDSDHVYENEHNIVSENLNGENIFKAIAEVPTHANITGIENKNPMILCHDNISIVGIANSVATSMSQAETNSQNELSANSQSIANADAFAEAVGIINQNKITTGKGNDTIIGIAISEATGSATALSQSQSASANSALAIANSEASVSVDGIAVGIDNQGVIKTGKGKDIIVGVASTTTMGNAEATALTNSITALAEHDSSTTNVIETAIAESGANATAISQTTTLGIINSGRILTGRGDDVIIGLATNNTVIDVQTSATANSTANDLARAMAEANSLGVATGATVGIVNSNRIHTGKGNDSVIGIAVSNATVNSTANDFAVAMAIDSESVTDSNAIADTLGAISIGIDNTSGLLTTGQGDDQVLGVGSIGITGGEFRLGKGSDLLTGYGSDVGVEEAKINLGRGDDLFQSAIVDVNPFTGEISFSDDQSGSIKNTSIFGGRGNDIFELGGFEETVSIDGGSDHDALKLMGSLDDYQFNLHSSDNQSLSIQDGDSILMVKNVESFHFGDVDHVYSFNDFA